MRTKWGGDLKVINTLSQGLKELGLEVEIVGSAIEANDASFAFLCSTNVDLRDDQKILELRSIPYGLIGFHEDTIQFFGASIGFFEYIRCAMTNKADDGVECTIEHLYEHPEVIHYFGLPPRRSNLINHSILKNAKICIASSIKEAKTMQRDCKSCNAHVAYIPSCFSNEFLQAPTDEFLSFTGLTSQSYILQVGRLEFRKNQLGSIIATKDLDIPLVLICSQGIFDWYEKSCLQACLQYRKAPTYIISQTMPYSKEKNVTVLPMPGGNKLSESMLKSAYFHAGLHLHPAFMELPGLTYFESLYLGVPTIASSWASINEYFSEPFSDDRLSFCSPYDLKQIQSLVTTMFGKRYKEMPAQACFKKTEKEYGHQVLSLIQPYMLKG